MKELQSIVNYELFYPAWTVAAAFDSGCSAGCSVTGCSCAVPSTYWSASTIAGNPNFAWYVGFGDGSVGENDGKGGDYYARAVRGGS